VAALEGDSTKIDELAERLTVQESYFFRHTAQLEFLSSTVFPEIAGHFPVRTPRIWSAGCAAGEEAYTLALLAAEHVRGAQVLGTDISETALRQAREAVYSRWALRSLTPQQIDRYFTPRDGRWRFRKSLAENVEFRRLNLAKGAYPATTPGIADLDLIVCRNVLIYFDPQVAREVTARLARCLRPGGWLVLGPSDPPITANADLQAVITPDGVYYRRRDTAGSMFEQVSGMPITATKESSAELPPAAAPPVSTQEEPASPLQAMEAAFARGAWHDVIALAENLLDNRAACALLVLALSNAGKPQEAAATAEKAMAAHPLCPELHVVTALVQIALKRGHESERLLRRALYLDSSMAMAHFLLGVLLERRGNTAASRTSYRNAIRSAEAHPADSVLPFSNGEPAARIVDAARQRLRALADSRKTA
jgi:chemotaxis protein methyltransferase CheR